MARSTPFNDPLHEQADALLPWYATGQLEAGERALVERHLEGCAACRGQLGDERRLVDGFRTLEPAIASGWARVRDRLASEAPIRSSAAPGVWTLLKRPAVAALAAAQLGFVVLAGSLFLALNRPAYQALGSAPAPAAANLLVMFDPQTPEARMRDALRASGTSLVGGPTEADAYLLHVDPAGRAHALDALRANGDVQLAQPIDRAPQ